MAGLFDVSTRIYRRLPTSFRNSATLEAIKARVLPHDLIYGAEYFARDVAPAADRAAPIISASIVEELNPRRVVDVGCGTGALLAALQARGCSVLGLEYADAALQLCRNRGLPVQKFDLERDDLEGQEKFDAAISMEVAEHLPKRVADRYVSLLTRLSDTVVFTAAHRGQGGTDHVNEQPPSYWLEKYLQHGFARDDVLSERWRNAWMASGHVQDCYYSNLMIFRRT